ncbi:ArnT family glycosyltransferase [Gymnodinialimonas hymeniacidonis]|uniref:ArnT family glycosyltransferase n=1 Tax=Gymnodinialimonas hymeniacidonis TaxID=3126508 RepID=UPI0034C687EE
MRRTRSPDMGLLAHRFAPWALLLLALLSFGVGLAELPVQDRDEARFAQAARQMADTGDLIDIRLLDQPRHNKPALIYWLQTTAQWVTGAEGNTPIWVHRLPSYLAGVLSVLALFWAARPLLGRRGALLAGIMCATIYMMHSEARTAKTDAALLLSVILAMGALGRVWLDQAKGWVTPAIFWTALAAGFLLKGPMVALPVVGAIAWCGWHGRSLGWLARLKPLVGGLWFLALSAPWFIAITLVTDGAFWSGSVGGDLTDKVLASGEHSGSLPGQYLLTTWFTYWPWTLLIPLALVYGWTTRKTPETAFTLGWLIPGWLVFEAVPVKLIHYTLPLYPALMILCAGAVVQMLDGKRAFRGWPAWIGSAGFALGAVLMAGLMVAFPVVYGPGVDGLSVVGAAVTLAAAVAALVAFWRMKVLQGMGALALAGTVMGWTLTAASLPAARDLWIAPQLADAMAAHECLAGPIALVGYQEPSAAFLLGGDVTLMDEDGALAYLSEDENRAAWIPTDEAGGVIGVTEIRGVNSANFRDVALRLWVSPGVPAPESPCD